jgi:uncharacterized membrane protein YjgN (DUF898 family)
MNQPSRIYPFKFTGDGGEYFRIWIVNLALTLVTLGIYSAWAKVRRKRYFSQHTFLAEHNFDYVASPIAILKGRLLAGALFLIYVLTGESMPLVSGALALALFLATPWIVTRSLQFNAYYTRHRGIAFHFRGKVGEAARIYILWGLAALFTLGLAMPYLIYRQTGFYAGNHAYGSTRSKFAGRAWPFFKVGLAALAILVVPVGLMLTGLAGVAAMARTQADPSVVRDMLILAGIGGVLIYLSLPLVIGYSRARFANLMFSNTRLGKLEFVSRHDARALIWLYFSNLLLIALTLGIYTPWAQVRLARYWLDNLDVLGAADGLDGFSAASGAVVAAAGTEMADVFDVDVSLT